MKPIHAERATELLVESLHGELSTENAQSLSAFEEDQPEFAREADRIRAQWASMPDVPSVDPPSQVSARFYGMLESFSQETSKSPTETRMRSLFSHRKWAVQWAAVAAALVFGLFIGRWMGPATADIDYLRDEVAYLDRMVMLSLLEQSSASRRLTAVERSTGRIGSDPELQQAILNTLQYDPNVNVRLAALDALAADFNTNLEIREKIWSAATGQRSPLVTATAVEMWAAAPDGLTKSAFEGLLQTMPDSILEPQLRQAIERLDMQER